MACEPFFLQTGAHGGDQRLCLHYPAQGSRTHGLVVYVHPLGEEMNKARRMAALQSRAFSRAGYAVLQIDLLGCGDSSGDFGDATWPHWTNDVRMACEWLRQRHTTQHTGGVPVPLWLWGLRSGCLVAVAAARQLNEPCHFLFWQAPASGKAMLQQFLRLKVAADLADGQGSGAMSALHKQLANGETVEIAGYMLSSALANELAQANLTPPVSGNAGRYLVWLELSSREDATPGTVSAQTVTAWGQAGFDTHLQGLSGPAFWQTNEIEEVPVLIAASTAAIVHRVGSLMPEAMTL